MRGGSERPQSHRPSVFAAASLAAALAFGVLATLVALGELDSIDSFAVRHLMPYQSVGHKSTTLIGTLLSYRGDHFHAGRALRLPASALLSTAFLLLACLILWRHGRRRSTALWIGAFVVANAVELACKLAITKPVLYAVSHGTLVAVGLRNSFPSGHAMRAALLAATLASIWRALWPVLAAWVVAVVVTLELDGVHAPSDILGGLLLAAALILIVLPLSRQPPPATSPSAASPRAVRPGRSAR